MVLLSMMSGCGHEADNSQLTLVDSLLSQNQTEEALQLLQTINREKGTAIVMVTHNRSICQRYPGRIFETRDESCKEITA